MSQLPLTLYRAEQVRELDRLTIESGVDGYVLMSRAGAVAYQHLCCLWPRARRLGVFCGLGNNAGDGYIVARLARQDGFDVQLVQVGDGNKLQGDALTAKQAWLDAGGDIAAFADIRNNSPDYDIAVDALLGTGLDRDLTGEWQDCVNYINRGATRDLTRVLAIDIPSGIHADTGAVMGVAVHASATMTFIGLKQGLFTAAAPDHTGPISFNHLDVPLEVYSKVKSNVTRLSEDVIADLLPARAPTAHKGQCGQVLLIGGAPGYTGALQMAGMAALRAGAGLVSLALPPHSLAVMKQETPELMCHAVHTVNDLAALIAKADCIAIGPGLGQDEWAQDMLEAVISTSAPLVVDADALNLLAAREMIRQNWVLTPHPGEAARLLEATTAQVQSDRFASLRALCDKYRATVVLKGAGTLVGARDDMVSVCTAGNAGMASGGMGDLLTGIITALIAQGLKPDDAARVGVQVHARAGDLAAGTTPRGLIATDLLPLVRNLVNPQR